jgi:hypothetical protein
MSILTNAQEQRQQGQKQQDIKKPKDQKQKARQQQQQDQNRQQQQRAAPNIISFRLSAECCRESIPSPKRNAFATPEDITGHDRIGTRRHP